MSKLSKFNEFLCEPACFNDGTFVISGELYSKKQATKLLIKEFNDHVSRIESNRMKPTTARMIECDRVRYCFMGGESGWWLGQDGKGSKPVYTLNHQQ